MQTVTLDSAPDQAINDHKALSLHTCFYSSQLVFGHPLLGRIRVFGLAVCSPDQAMDLCASC